MKIAICMWYDDKIKEYADISRQINQRYCDTHGYDFIVSHENHFFDRHPAWERFPMIQSILDEGIYDYVVYIDADACFRHSCSRSLETIIAENADKHIIFTGDPEYILCTGFLIFKNSQISADFIGSVIDAEYSKTMFYKHPWEQHSTICCYQRNLFNIQAESIIISYGILQSFAPEKYPDSLIIHFERRSTEVRVEALTAEAAANNIIT